MAMDDENTFAPDTAGAEPAEPVNQEQAKAPEPQDADDFEDEGVETEGDGSEEDAPEPEDAEIEYEGKQYKVPKELKDAFLRNADYTRKTQEVAATRREVEQMKQQATQMLQASEQELDMRAELRHAKNVLEQYRNLDWAALENEDPIGAQSHWRQFQMLKERAGELDTHLRQSEAQRTEAAERDIANRVSAARSEAQKAFKDWTPQLENEVVEFATKTLGADGQKLLSILDPVVYKGLILAYRGYQAMNRPSKPKAVQQPVEQQAQPTKTVSGRSAGNPKGLRDDISTEEWVRRRNAQLAGRR